MFRFLTMLCSLIVAIQPVKDLVWSLSRVDFSWDLRHEDIESFFLLGVQLKVG